MLPNRIKLLEFFGLNVLLPRTDKYHIRSQSFILLLPQRLDKKAMAINMLILTDYSEHSLNAAKYALNLSETTSNFYILNSGSTETELMDKFISELSREPEAAKHKFCSLFSTENLIEATRKTVTEKNIDLIVMGASGKSSSQIKGLGNNTYNVIRKVKCPVLTVTENQQFKPWENLLFPIDYGVLLHENTLGIFKKLPLLALSVFNIWEINAAKDEHKLNSYRTEINSKLSPQPVNFSEIEVADQLGGQFWKNAKSSANLVVLMARNLKISDELLLHPLVAEKGKNTRPPVLILHG